MPPTVDHPLLPVRDLSALDYASALAIQRETHAHHVARRDDHDAPVGTLLLVEHDPPVITLSKRAERADHLLASEDLLAQMGVTLHATDRGGDITYHGPGQLVAYPILDLNRLTLGLHDYIRALEQLIIDTCAHRGLPTARDPSATGVWTLDEHHEPRAKVAAIGIRVKRWVSMHGLALNLSTDLTHFDLIVPCGLAGRPVTSLARELDGRAPSMPELKADLAARFQHWVSERIDA